MSVEYVPDQLIVNALCRFLNSLFDLVVRLSNIARFPLHLSPYIGPLQSALYMPIRGANKHPLNEQITQFYPF